MPTGYFLLHMHTMISRNAVHVLLLTSPVNYSDTGKGRCLNVDNNNLSKPICVIKWMSTRRASDKRYGNPLLLFQQSLCFGGGVGANYSLLPNAPSLESREGKAPNARSLLSTADTDLHSAHLGPDVRRDTPSCTNCSAAILFPLTKSPLAPAAELFHLLHSSNDPSSRWGWYVSSVPQSHLVCCIFIDWFT